jgi:hypothetical protein
VWSRTEERERKLTYTSVSWASVRSPTDGFQNQLSPFCRVVSASPGFQTVELGSPAPDFSPVDQHGSGATPASVPIHRVFPPSGVPMHPSGGLQPLNATVFGCAEASSPEIFAFMPLQPPSNQTSAKSPWAPASQSSASCATVSAIYCSSVRWSPFA